MPLPPITAFDDNLRPAKLLLKLYRLMDAEDVVLREGQLVEQLRGVIGANTSEEILVVHHLLATAVVRDRAEMRPSELKRLALKNLLRQAVVSSCTALDAFLPALLRANLPTIIARVGRSFFPSSDGDVKEYFKNVSFSVEDVLALQERPPLEAAEFVANRLLSDASFRYLGSAKGVAVTASLLQLKQPWDALAAHLSEDKKALRNTVDLTTRRRNDIVHRADRGSEAPDAEHQQDIEYSQALQGVTVIEKVCHALDELVKRRLAELPTTVGAAT